MLTTRSTLVAALRAEAPRETAEKCFRERLVPVKVRGAYDNEMFLERCRNGLLSPRRDVKKY